MTTWTISRWLIIIAVLSAIGIEPTRAQQTEETRYSIVFRAVHLTEALQSLVDLTGADLVYDDALVEGVQVYCSIQQALPTDVLACLLKETDLDYVVSSTGALVIIRSPHEAPRRASIAGRVIDAETGEPLPFAHVFLASAGTTTNSDGLFTIGDLVPGWYRVLASFVGYETRDIDAHYIGEGNSEIITIPLKPAAGTLTPIVVDGLTQRPLSASLGLAELEPDSPRPPGINATPDVIRGAASTIGISSALPFADLHIQGGNTAEHVTRLDGVPVRDPVALGRYLGAFSPLAVGLLTVHKGGFSAARGSHLTGTIDARHRLNFVHPDAALQVDPVALNLRAGTPVHIGSARGSAMVALRHSTWVLHADRGIDDLFRKANQIDPVLTGLWLGYPIRSRDLMTQRQVPDVRFSDLHAAMVVRPSPLTSVSASVYRAGNYVATQHAAFWEDPRFHSALTFDDVYDWKNWAGQAAVSHILGARAVAGVNGYMAIHTSSYDYDYLREPAATNGAPSAGAGAERLSAGAAHDLREVGLAGTLSYSIAPRSEIESGLSIDYVDATFGASNSWISPFSHTVTEARIAGFVDGRHSLTPRVTLDVGSRLTFLPTNGAWYAEPRASARYDGALGDSHTYALRASAGAYRQFVSGVPFRNAGPAAIVPEIWFWMPSGQDLGPPLSTFVGADAALFLKGGLTVRAETFFRQDRDIPTLNIVGLRSSISGSDTPSGAELFAQSRGRAIGAGVGAQWSGSRGLAAIAYSYESALRIATGDENTLMVAVPWEEPHRLSMDGRLNLGRALSLHSSARGVWGRSWALRRAYYDYLPAVDDIAQRVSSPESDELPALLLVDINGSYRLATGPVGIRVEVGVANLFNRLNVLDYSFEVDAATDAMLPRTLPGRRATFAVRFDI